MFLWIKRLKPSLFVSNQLPYDCSFQEPDKHYMKTNFECVRKKQKRGNWKYNIIISIYTHTQQTQEEIEKLKQVYKQKP